jgi:hypothetical protein
LLLEREEKMQTDRSAIARLRRQIVEEMEAMQRGFQGFAAGTARHDFIQARMRNINDHQQRLAEHVGSGDAVTIVCELYMSMVQVPSHKRPNAP